MLKSLFTRLAPATTLAISTALPVAAQEGSLTISGGFGPTAEFPDPRASYNGWMSNQTGVTETLMGIDDDMTLYPRLAESIEQSAPTTWRVTLRDGLKFHDGTPVTAQAMIDAVAPISDEAHPGHNARIASLLDLADMSADGDTVVVFETNSSKAAFPWTLSEPGIAILGGSSEELPINGNGPFIFKEAIPEQLYGVEANTDYRLGTPGLEEVRVGISVNPGARL